jgi:hypothetical protein
VGWRSGQEGQELLRRGGPQGLCAQGGPAPGLPELLQGVLRQLVGGHVQGVSPLQELLEPVLPPGHLRAELEAELPLQPPGMRLEGLPRPSGRRQECGRPDPLPGRQRGDSPPEEGPGPLALPERPGGPAGRGRTHGVPGTGQEVRYRRQPLRSRLHPLVQGSEVGQQEGDDSGERLPGVPGGIPPLEVRRGELPLLQLQRPHPQVQIQPLHGGGAGEIQPPGLLQEPLHGGQRVAGSVLGAVGKPVVVPFHPDEGGVHRTAGGQGGEEAVEPGGRGGQGNSGEGGGGGGGGREDPSLPRGLCREPHPRRGRSVSHGTCRW